jgi:hypothetical protein
VQWRPDLDNPLRESRDSRDDDGQPVLGPITPEPPESDAGAAWHFCGVGVRDKDKD